jgi:diaminohydroxyphosphoribosylaminopyrimidine deaminase/5-amino-6-(5-phosphoribosylamino)uracil reductase
MSAPGGVTLKLATSLDGRIATASGESRWITGPEARRVVHELRAVHQAVMVGIETALADDPDLGVRLDGYMGAQPARVVLDSRQRLPVGAGLVQTARARPTYLITIGEPAAELRDQGVIVTRVAEDLDGRPDPEAVVEALCAQGLERIMLEGGGRVAASFLAAGLVERIEWFRAPMILGAEGRPAVGALAMSRLAGAPRFRRVEVKLIGDDLWERYERL